MVKVITWSECGLPEVSKILDACSVTKNGMVYTSGSLGMKPDGTAAETLEEQTEIAIKNLETVLKTAGSSLQSVVKVLIFLTDPSYFPRMNAVYAKYFTTKPPRSCVVTKLGSTDFFVEIELIAEVE